MAGYRPCVAALLGPTNTGKTHYALDRMLGHRTGVIGLPLRLLAREVYDRLVARRGPSVVGLITGEERVVPPRTQYWVATVEAMPQGIGADFVAIDEIQLCADPGRGHVFTDRLLRMRGTRETLFLGSDTMHGPIAALVPGVKFLRRDRLSQLVYRGAKKISRIPVRSAIVTFSVENVYAIAELMRRQKGGAAVVMGALSPRTRNAQVQLYQSGDVDYLVATDAIGMGLNLDVSHVAFAGLSKFDGRRLRCLAPNEIAQIAGRAGRYKTDGTFGVTGQAPPLQPELVAAIEHHRSTPVRNLHWRNSDISFNSLDRLIDTLTLGSDNPRLVRMREADDLRTLRNLAGMSEVRARATGGASVRLLWDCCQIPDFRQVSTNEHNAIARKIFELLHETGELPHAWLADQVARIDKNYGDIDTLAKRLAYVRTWTYVAQRKGWVSDETYWRDKTRAVEDRLSDALHAALTQRFVDQRTSVLMRRLKQKEILMAEVNAKGEVTVEGQFAGQLRGFRFHLDPNATGEGARILRRAAVQALVPEFNLMGNRIYNAPDTGFDITEQGNLMWGEDVVGRLVKGPDVLSPGIEAFVDVEAGEDVARKVRHRLGHFVNRRIEANFEQLVRMRDDAEVTGLARGLAFQLVEALGVIPRSVVAGDVKALDQDARSHLRKHGVRFGNFTIFQPHLLKPAPTRLRLILWSLVKGFCEFPPPPPPGLVTIPQHAAAPHGYYTRAGYRLAGEWAIRVDMLERLADLIRKEDTRGGFECSPDMLSITGMTLDQFANLMAGLGYSVKKGKREKKRTPHPATPATAEVPVAPVAQQAEPVPEDAASQPDSNLTAEAADTAPESEVFYIFCRGGWKRFANQGHKPGGKRKARVKPCENPDTARFFPRRKEKQVDPDNPFAALAALKSKS
ncbi:MAG: disulfide oxidoreductase [Rhodobacteraceae bacterium]|nr:disulfide oxidoreductase [Paracoccaceae bacterium]